MSVYIVLGAQWGDEGKGKFVHVLSNKVDYIVRYQGGNNAGHTIITKKGKFIMRLLPSGILEDNVTCIIGNGVVLDPKAFLQELEILKSAGINNTKIYISNRAHVIMPYHIKIDELDEANSTNIKIGTTKKGIGPCYADKYNRTGIKVADLINKESFKNKLSNILPIKNQILSKIYNAEEFKFKAIFKEYQEYAEQIKPFVSDTTEILQKALKENKKVLFEGSQGAMLDIDFGTYPYVTSSNTTSGGVFSNTGIPPKQINKIIGISKAYTTRVGEGPFPTEINNDLGNIIREKGNEYGSVTKRPRRCGWLDIVALKYAININGLTDIILTKIDILGNLPDIKVCTGYKINKKITNSMPTTLEELNNITPIYKTFKSWTEDISNIKDFNSLPKNCKDFILELENLLECPISIVSVGPEQNQTIFRNNII